MKTVLILGSMNNDTIHTAIKANKYEYVSKELVSGAKNWESICSILENDKQKNILILGKFTEYIIFLFTLDEYKPISNKLLSLIKERKHIIFIYNNNFFKDFSCMKINEEPSNIPFFDTNGDFVHKEIFTNLQTWLLQNELWYEVDEYIERLYDFINSLNNDSFNLSPYRKLIDINVAVQVFIESVDQGLLFQLYIPNKRIWSKELDKFIVLFRDFASTIIDDDVKLVQNRTDRGVTFSIYSVNSELNSESIEELFNEFSRFLDLCIQKPDLAIQILESQTNLSKDSIQVLISKYSKEAKRLMIDLKQEREIKLLSIKHQLEVDISEIEINISQLTENTLPKLSNPSDLLNTRSNINNNIIINNNPQFIHTVNGIVSREIYGNIDFNEIDHQLNDIIEKYAKDKAELAILKSSHNEIKDESLNKSTKTIAWQKLQKFLGKCAEKVGDVGIHFLKKYLEGQLDL